MTTTSPAATTGDASQTDRNKHVILEFLGSLTRGDVDRYLDFLDESLTWWTAGTIEGISGTIDKATYAALTRAMTAAAKNGEIRLIPSGLVAEGEFVAVESESYIEFTNGRIYNNQYHYLFQVRNGKIIAVKEYMDTAHVIESVVL